MTAVLAIVTTLAVLAGTVVPTVAQQPSDSVRDILADIFAPVDHAPTDVVRGYVEEHREATLVLRGEDGRVHRINTAGLDAAALARLEEGRLLMLALKSGNPGAMPIASAVEGVEIEPSASIAGDALERMHGVIGNVGLATLTLTTDAGIERTVEITRLTEPARVRPGERVTIVGRVRHGDRARFIAEQIVAAPPDTPAPAPGR